MTDVEALTLPKSCLGTHPPYHSGCMPGCHAFDAAALTASGMTLIPTEELAGLRAIEDAARDADPTPGQAITSAPAIAALRAALEAKGTRP